MQTPTAQLKAYLPSVSLRSAAVAAPVEPSQRRLWASCLWLDMSGFTPLTERLSAEGPDGIERLSQTLNELYRAVAGVAAETRGDVMFFAGDGALCLWEASDPSRLGDATWLAANAAIQLLERLSLAGTEDVRIEVRQVVVAGELTLSTVGGDQGVWQDVASGEPLLLLPQLGAACHKGQVLLSEAALRTLGDRAAVQRQEGGGFALLGLIAMDGSLTDAQAKPESAKETAATAAAKVPGFLSSQLRDARGPASELRRVSVVFSRWKTQKAPSAANLQQLTSLFQQTARRHHGWLCQLVHDDKGLSGVTVFGLPGHAQGEDGVRAVRFAREMAEQCDALGLRVSFGVATGSAFCGVRGDIARSQYCVLGNPVNRAARLAELATDTPLVDENTFASAHWRVDFTRHGSLALKGLPHAVEAYCPGAPRESRLAPSALVSFEQERAELADWLRGFVTQGENQPLLVRGELGSGKTAFLGSVPACCAESGIDVASGTCDEFDQHTAYFPLRAVMRRLLGDPSEAAGAARLKEALHRLGLLDQMALLNPLLLADFEPTTLVSQMSPATRTENRKQLVTALLRDRLGARRLLVVIDDAQWLDAASLELLLALRAQLRSFAVLLAARAPAHQLGERLGSARELSIHPLDAPGVGRLVALLLQARECDEALSHAIYRGTGGNPLHCTELLRALVASGRVQVTPERVSLTLATEEPLEVPGTLEELIQARFDRLSVRTRDVLRNASVLGVVLDMPVLSEMLTTAGESGAFKEALEEALEAGIVHSRGTHQFEHASIQAVVYRLLLPSEQRQLHERAARALAKVHGAALKPVAARLAYHWLRAGNAEQAARFSAMAAEQALQGYANVDAEHLFRQALAQDTALRGTLDVSLERAHWSLLMSQALYSQSRYAEARGAIEAAMRWTGMAVPGGIEQLPWTAVKALGRGLAAKLGVKTPPARGAARERRILITRIINAALELDAWEGRLFEAANKAVIAYLMSRSVSDAPEAAETVGGLGYLLAATPARSYAQPLILEGIQAADASDDLQARTSTRVLLGMFHTLNGRTGEAEEPLRVAKTLAERLGSGLWRHRAWFGLGEALLCGGKLRAAADAFARAAEIAALAEPPVEGFANCMAALTLARSGRLQEAQELALGARGLALVTGNCLVLQRFTSLGVAAELSLATGEAERAATFAREALALSRSRPDVNVFFAGLHGHTGCALTLLTLLEQGGSMGQRGSARHVAEAKAAVLGLKSFARMYPAARPAYELLRGRVLYTQGAKRRAESCFARALLLANDRQPFEQLLAQHWSTPSTKNLLEGAAFDPASDISLRASAWCRPSRDRA